MRPAFCLLLFVSAIQAQQGIQPAQGGSACVVAKKLGDSLAIEWAVGETSVSQAIAMAKQALSAKGHTHAFPQANSALPHGWMAVIKTEYTTFIGKKRTSYGCGFSAASPEEAESRAVTDLRAYSWGWKPSHGYARVQLERY